MCLPTAAPENPSAFWRPQDDLKGLKGTGAAIFRPDLYKVIERKIDELDEELRELSLDIHGE